MEHHKQSSAQATQPRPYQSHQSPLKSAPKKHNKASHSWSNCWASPAYGAAFGIGLDDERARSRSLMPSPLPLLGMEGRNCRRYQHREF